MNEQPKDYISHPKPIVLEDEKRTVWDWYWTAVLIVIVSATSLWGSFYLWKWYINFMVDCG